MYLYYYYKLKEYCFRTFKKKCFISWGSGVGCCYVKLRKIKTEAKLSRPEQGTRWQTVPGQRLKVQRSIASSFER